MRGPITQLVAALIVAGGMPLVAAAQLPGMPSPLDNGIGRFGKAEPWRWYSTGQPPLHLPGDNIRGRFPVGAGVLAQHPPVIPEPRFQRPVILDIPKYTPPPPTPIWQKALVGAVMAAIFSALAALWRWLNGEGKK
jgi:hypothetical protein